MFRLYQSDLGRSLKAHLAPFLFPSPDGERPRNDLRAAFEATVAAQVELNSFNSRSADAFSFDDSIDFVRKGKRLDIVVREPASREAWERDGRKLDRLHGYWFYRAMDEFINRGLAEPTLFERPIRKIGQQLIELPWVFGLQNNSTAAINSLRRLGARRAQAGLETRRIEERLGNLFESRGFCVVLNWEPEDDTRAGEVDLICGLDQKV